MPSDGVLEICRFRREGSLFVMQGNDPCRPQDGFAQPAKPEEQQQDPDQQLRDGYALVKFEFAVFKPEA